MSKPSFKKTIKKRKLFSDYRKKRALNRSTPVTTHEKRPKVKAAGMNEEGKALVRVIGEKWRTVRAKRKQLSEGDGLPKSKKFQPKKTK